MLSPKVELQIGPIMHDDSGTEGTQDGAFVCSSWDFPLYIVNHQSNSVDFGLILLSLNLLHKSADNAGINMRL